MLKEKVRFFTDDMGRPVIEKIVFISAGSSCVLMSDPRCISIGELGPTGVDKWIPIAIGNPAFNKPVQEVVTEKRYYISDDNTVKTYDAIVSVQSLPVIDPYNSPLKAGWVEIAMKDYNNMITANP